MSNDSHGEKIAKETALAVVSIVSSPLTAVLKVIGTALGRPDLSDTVTNQLLDDVARLHRDYVARISALEADVRARLNAEELVEVIMQVHANMARTASAEKRTLMRNVAVNGVDPRDSDQLELRLFIQALAELDIAHIDVLRHAVESEPGVIELPTGDVGTALAQALESRGFARPIVRVGSSYDAGYNIPIPPTYEVTRLGTRFVEFLREP